MKTSALVKCIKEENQDFEWYPTTEAMLQTVKKDALKLVKDRFNDSENLDVIDCGAGDGRALNVLAGEHGTKYAIEKSKVLIDAMQSDIFIIGTEFKESTLIDKKSDIVFCNPPYSEYQEWAEKVISEANAQIVYLIIPDRWKNSDVITAAIEARQAEATVIKTDTFINAERSSRAKVDVIRVNIGLDSTYRRGIKTDPFSIWFDKTFKKPGKTEKNEKTDTFENQVKNEIVKGRNLIEALVSLYDKEMNVLNNNFLSISSLDAGLLNELDVSQEGLKVAIKQRIEGLKNKYWKEFFNNYETLTDKLTNGSREKILWTLRSNMNVDFTASNAYAVTTWAIKNANKYFDTQLINLVEGMVQQANIKMYKSNQRTFEKNEWRYCSQPEGLNKYALELRLVLTNKGGLNKGYSWERQNGLSKRSHEFLQDILTIANNLGYGVPSWTLDNLPEWESNKKQEFYINVVQHKMLMSVKAFKNGNLHIKFNQSFIRKLNVEFGRLKGWLKDHKQASHELNIPEKEAMKYFKGNFKLTGNSANLLCIGQDAEQERPTQPETEGQSKPRIKVKSGNKAQKINYENTDLNAIKEQYKAQL